MNYNIDAQVNYKIFSHISDNVEIDICMSEVVYQENFLDAFYLQEYDEQVVSNQQTLLLNLLIEKEEVVEILSCISKKLNIDDPEFSFIYLFSYPLFYLTHNMICHFIDKGVILPEIFEKLVSEIENM